MSGLSRYNPVWEQARARDGAGRVFEDDSIGLATDFESGNGTDLRCIGPDHYAVTLETEPGDHPYSGNGYYLCVGVVNRRSEARSVLLRVQAPTKPEWRWAAQMQHMILRRGGEWSQLDPAAIRQVDGTGDTVDIDLPLPARDGGVGRGVAGDGVLFVSNYHWWPYSEAVEWLRSLPAERARVTEIGRSFQGRAIYAVEIGDGGTGAPCMVHTQTPQPAEMGSLACRAMVDYLCSDEPEAAAIRRRFRTCFIPMTNPDGTVMGYGVSDTQGRFPFFEGHLAAGGDPTATPETALVWRYLEDRRPWLFWEWHSNHWSRRPGHMLLRYAHDLVADEARRRVWDDLEERLLTLPDTHHASWTSHTEGQYQNSMGFQAATRLGAITCMIKQHDKFPLTQSREHAIGCLRHAAAVWPA
jgi:hypothetical protein